MRKSKQLERLDAVKGNTFASATKQPWECKTYAEFLASLPDDEQPQPDDGDRDEEA